MITCPNCGTQNEAGSHFCQECGADLGSLATPQPLARQAPSSGYGAPARPTWVAGQGWVGNQPTATPHTAPPVVHQEPPSTSRTWLRALLLAIAILIVLCCVSSLYASTDRGTEQLNRLGTWSAEHK